jgi:GT2 family glycosyltransferase
MSTNCELSLSLVITSYTTERLNDIYELLDSIKQQTYRNMETIFVVERSQELRDKLNDYIKEKKIDRVRIVFSDKKLGLSMARNLGIENATGDIIGFVDDDVVLFPDWAEQMVKAFDNDSIIGVTGAILPLWENDSLKWLPEPMYWLISCTAWTNWDSIRLVRGVIGANMAFQATAFNDKCFFSADAGYIDSHKYTPVSDDLEFSLRIKKKTGLSILFTPNARVWHRVYNRRLSFRYVSAKSQEVGRCRRILKRTYSSEFGSYGQEQHVLRSIINCLLENPIEVFKRPKIAWNKFVLVFIILSSVLVGYIMPKPMYSPFKNEQKAN